MLETRSGARAGVVGCALVLLGALAHGAPPACGQDLSGWNPELAAPAKARPFSVGLDFGYPLVVGVQGGYSFTPRLAARVGVTALGDFTALSGEMRLNLTRFRVEAPLPFVAGGFTQYYLADGPRETSPLATHLALGIEYVFFNYVGAAARVGYLNALGGAKDASVDRYGISDNVSSWFFTVAGRYLF